MAFPRRGFLKSANRRNELYCRIDASGVAGIFVFLLALFIVTTPSHRGRWGVDLPVVAHPRPVPFALREDAIRVTATRDDTIYLRSMRVKLDELPNRMRHANLNGAEKNIYFVVHARAYYGEVKSVLPLIQLAGIENVCFLTW